MSIAPIPATPMRFPDLQWRREGPIGPMGQCVSAPLGGGRRIATILEPHESLESLNRRVRQWLAWDLADRSRAVRVPR